ncbi:head-tail connector protein [Mammaliicoccus lentus]|uniref:head-tail connector protein n=1 Tax=Mammaliicoccus lentus TaxID=42858 RepID=UPI001C4DFFE0|nr:head-tail connector protein [Mammaliicoccus lentus]MBW0770503.1 head-tail connector protein [Mammaliicoccus lentus]
MFELTIENIKQAIHVDDDFDDNYIEGLLLPQAEQYVRGVISNGSDEEFYKDNLNYRILVLNIIGHHNENRSTTSQFIKHPVPASSRSLLQRLRGEYAIWKLENSNTE